MSLLETSLEVVKLAAKVANPELVQAATRANIEALELSKQNIELHKHAGDLQTKIKELEAKLSLVGEVFRKGHFIYHDGDPGPHCSRCWDVEHKLVHIIMLDKGAGRGIGPGCPECKTFTQGGLGINPRM
jgi:hypothetical protein